MKLYRTARMLFVFIAVVMLPCLGVMSGNIIAADGLPIGAAATPDLKSPRAWTGHADTSPGEILAGLTLEEKVGQLFIIYHGPPEFMAEHGFGGSLIFQSMVKKPDELRASLASCQELCKIPLLVAIDQEGGEVNRLRPVPGLEEVASAAELGQLEPAIIDQYLEPVTRAMLDLGINTNLAPVVDPAFDGLGNITLMGQRGRAFGSSTEEIAPTARAFIKSFATRNLGCIIKHFPGYNVATNSDHELAVSTAGSQEVDAQKQAFAEVMPGALGVMMSSIRFTEYSEYPAVLDPNWVSQARCGYNDRLVMTDDLWGAALRGWVSGQSTVHPTEYPPEDLKRLTMLAFDAGNDMLMVTYPAKAVEMKSILVFEIQHDSQRTDRLNQAVLRILRAKLDLGLFAR